MADLKGIPIQVERRPDLAEVQVRGEARGADVGREVAALGAAEVSTVLPLDSAALRLALCLASLAVLTGCAVLPFGSEAKQDETLEAPRRAPQFRGR